MKAGQSGVSTQTVDNIFLGAGTIHKGLKYDDGSKKWNFTQTCIGATQGGSKFSVKPEIKSIEPDGAFVPVKGLQVKVGESVTLEVNLVEVTPEIIKKAIIGTDGESSTEAYSLIESKPHIEDGDYLENIAFVGSNLKGENLIIILENALCTSGFDFEGKNKDNSVVKATFKCHAPLEGDHNKLPYKIYYPKQVKA